MGGFLLIGMEFSVDFWILSTASEFSRRVRVLRGVNSPWKWLGVQPLWCGQ